MCSRREAFGNGGSSKVGKRRVSDLTMKFLVVSIIEADDCNSSCGMMACAKKTYSDVTSATVTLIKCSDLRKKRKSKRIAKNTKE